MNHQSLLILLTTVMGTGRGFEGDHPCRYEEYIWQDKDSGMVICRPCTECLRGQGMISECRKDRDTVCETCRVGTVSRPDGTGGRQCFVCFDCAGWANRTTQRDCTRFEDTLCGDCINSMSEDEKGYCNTTPTRVHLPGVKFSSSVQLDPHSAEKPRLIHCRVGRGEYLQLDSNSRPLSCHRCTLCPERYGTAEPCGRHKDTLCLPCGGRTYSVLEDNTRVCRNCTDCLTAKREIRRHCTRSRNAICGSCWPGYYEDGSEICKRDSNSTNFEDGNFDFSSAPLRDHDSNHLLSILEMVLVAVGVAVGLIFAVTVICRILKWRRDRTETHYHNNLVVGANT